MPNEYIIRTDDVEKKLDDVIKEQKQQLLSIDSVVELAIAAWRMSKWLDNLNADRKMAAKSSLRSINKILKETGVETIDITGSKFDVGLSVDVINNEAPEVDEDELIISEMVSPIVKIDGAVKQRGKVILGTDIKKPKKNTGEIQAAKEVKNEGKSSNKKLSAVAEIDAFNINTNDKDYYIDLNIENTYYAALMDRATFQNGSMNRNEAMTKLPNICGRFKIEYPATWYLVVSDPYNGIADGYNIKYSLISEEKEIPKEDIAGKATIEVESHSENSFIGSPKKKNRKLKRKKRKEKHGPKANIK